jgi:probable rRNA maturation factor
MIKVNFFNKKQFEFDQEKLVAKIEQVLKEHKIEHAQLDLSLVGNKKITQLNEQYLNHSGPTDVLSFPTYENVDQIKKAPASSDQPPHIGQLVISYPYVLAEAKSSGKSLANQLSFYIEHGLLHLLGYHHE